jgi:predicted DNA-binding transcriptional regulator AlpA
MPGAGKECVIGMTGLSTSRARPIPRRGLSRIESAMYLGISPSKFDEMVKDHRMPKARSIDGRKVWTSMSWTPRSTSYPWPMPRRSRRTPGPIGRE